MADCNLVISMADLKQWISNAVEVRVSAEVKKIGNLLALDMHAMIGNVDDEIERLGRRLKNMEELLHDWKSTQHTDQIARNETQTYVEKADSKNKKQCLVNRNTEDNEKRDNQEQESRAGNNSAEQDRCDDGWTVVKSKRAKKRRGYESGAVLIGGGNVRRISTAENEEFRFGKNIIFKSAQEVSSADISQELPSAVKKTNAEAVDVVFHYGVNDVAGSTVDCVLEGFAHVISVAKKQSSTRDVVVCSVVERRDAGRGAADTARLVNDQLEALCAAYGARYLDLRDRLKECAHGGVNRTGHLYTWDGARNVSQLILSEVNVFLD